jgi:hypothetical protein
MPERSNSGPDFARLSRLARWQGNYHLNWPAIVRQAENLLPGNPVCTTGRRLNWCHFSRQVFVVRQSRALELSRAVLL